MILTLSLSVGAQYRNVSLPQSPKQSHYRDYQTQNCGFWWGADLEGGSSAMMNNKNMQYAQADLSAGYRLSQYIRLGVGVGCRYYANNAEVRNTDSKFSIPIFATARGNFISAYDRDGVPFWAFNIGGITQEGFYMSPTIGYNFGGLRNTFNIGINYTLSCFENSHHKDKAYSYFGIRLGYEF